MFTLCFYSGMRIITDIFVTINAGDSFFAVNGEAEFGWVDRDWERFASEFNVHTFLLMAGKTEIIGRFIFLISRRCLGRRSESGHGENQKREAEEQEHGWHDVASECPNARRANLYPLVHCILLHLKAFSIIASRVIIRT